MKPTRLLAHFERISDAPDAVPRLRQFILELAFLARFSDGRQRAITAGQSHNGEPWRTKTAGEIATEITPGFACAKSHQMENGFVHLRTHNVSANGRLNFDLLIRVDPRRIDASKAGLRKNDILFNNTNSQELVGKTCLVDDDYEYAFSNHLTRIRVRPEIDPSYLVKYFTLLLWRGDFARLCNRWIGQAGINTASLRKIEVPIPPFDEQRRIVAKVDELMALCDRLEAAQAERESRRDRLVAASLHRLNEPADPPDFREHTQFHLRHLPRLATRPEHVQQLRQTILDLATRGKLTSHWRLQQPRHKDASQIVKALEQAHELAGGHRRGNAAAPTEAAHDLDQSELPGSWRMTDLRIAVDPARPITYGILMPGPDTPGGIPYVRVADFPNDQLNLATIRRTTPEIETAYTRARLQEGDILLSIRGTIGRVCIVPKELQDANITQDTARLSIQPALDRDFVVWFLRSPAAQERMRKCQKGVAVRGINIGDVRALQLPVPPLPEQRYIVAKVNELFAVCDRLEARLATAQSESRRLLEAVLHEALAPPA